MEADVLTPEAVEFLTELERRFGPIRQELLARRHERAQRLRDGELPDFLPETSHLREGDWGVAPVPDELQDRRVAITGPVERKMVLNALHSGAKPCQVPPAKAATARPARPHPARDHPAR